METKLIIQDYEHEREPVQQQEQYQHQHPLSSNLKYISFAVISFIFVMLIGIWGGFQLDALKRLDDDVNNKEHVIWSIMIIAYLISLTMLYGLFKLCICRDADVDVNINQPNVE